MFILTFMQRFKGITGVGLVSMALCAPGLRAQSSQAQVPQGQHNKGQGDQVQVRQVKVLNSKGAVEIEVATSDRVVPETKVLTGPDRLVVDFPNSIPGHQLRSQSVYKGDVKDLRVGLFQANPPVTRIVFDLDGPKAYQVFPYGRSVVIKLTGGDDSLEAEDSAANSGPSLVVANYTTGAERLPASAAARPILDVSFRQGMLAIKANKATLSEVLFAVQQRTGAEVAIAAGADQEKVVADLGPAPPAEVLSRLLNGSKFNFMIISAADNPQKLERIVLSPRNEALVVTPQSPAGQSNDDDDETPIGPAPAVRPAPNGPPPPVATQPTQPPDTKAPDDGSSPQ